MEKPSILNVFEDVYNNKRRATILIDLDSILKIVEEGTGIFKFTWLPGAEELLGLLSETTNETFITIWHERHHAEDIKQLLRRGRIFADIKKDPCLLSDYSIIISKKSGINYTDFPAIKEFLKKLE